MQGPFGEDGDPVPGAEGLGQPPGVRDAPRRVETVDVEHADPVQEPARQRVVPKLGLRDEADRARDGRREDQPVEVARVVRGDDARPAPAEGFGGALDGQPDPREPEDRAGGGPHAGVTEAGAPDGHRGEGRDRSRQREGAPEPPREGEVARPARRPPSGRPGPTGREPGDTEPERPGGSRRRGDLPGLVALGHRAPADLAARGLEHGVRRREHRLVDRLAEPFLGEAPERGADLRATRRVRLPGLRHRHQPLRAGLRPAPPRPGREQRDAAPPDPREVPRRLLEVVGVEVAPGPDHDVLDPPGDEQLAARDVGEVARFEPVPVEQGGGRGAVAVVAARRRRPAELEPPLHPLRGLASAVVHRADLEPRDRDPARHEPEGGSVPRRRRRGAPLALEGAPRHPFDEGPAPDRGERDPEGRLREPVDRGERVRVEAEGREPRGEGAEGVRVHRLGPVERDPPGGEVEPLDLLVRDPPRAQLEREVRPPGEGPPMAVYGAEPPGRAGEEGERGHEDEGEPVHRAPEPRRDEAEVVVEGEPAHEDVTGARGEGAGHRVEAREHVAMGEHHPLRLAGAPRGVLEEGDVVRAGARPEVGVGHPRARPRLRLRQLAHGRDPEAAGRPRGEEPGHLPGFVEGDEPFRVRVLEDPLVPPEVVLELGKAGRGIDGKRDPAGDLDPEEAPEVVEAGREHDRHRPPRSEPARDEAGGDPVRALEERAVGEDRLRLPVVDEAHVGPFGMRRRVPREGVDQGGGVPGDGVRGRVGGGAGIGAGAGIGRGGRAGSPDLRPLTGGGRCGVFDARGRVLPARGAVPGNDGVPGRPGPRLTLPIRGRVPRRLRLRVWFRLRGRGGRGLRPHRLEGAQKLPRGLRLRQHPVREARPRGPFEAGEQLHPRQAVETEVAGEVRVEMYGGRRPAAARPQLARDPGDEGDQGSRVQAGRRALPAPARRGAAGSFVTRLRHSPDLLTGARARRGFSPNTPLADTPGAGASWERLCPARIFVHGRFAPGYSIRCGRDTSAPGDVLPKAPQ